MPFTFISLANFYGGLRHISQSLTSVELRAELMVIFRNSAHSSPVIYGRDPGPAPGSRFLDRECRRLGHRSECLKPLLRKVVKRRGPKGWNYFRWTYADIVPRPALTRGVAGLSRIILYLARLGPFELPPFCDFNESK